VPTADAPTKEAEMSNVARRRFARGGVLAVLIALLLLVFVACGPFSDTTYADAGSGDGRLGSSGSLTIEGNAVGLISPGLMAPLDLSLTNPHDVPMSVTGLRVRVQQVSAPNADDVHPCTVSDFAVDQTSSSRKITVAAHSTRTLSSLGLSRENLPHVGMLDRPVNQDGCKGASLALAYTASGTLER
jgi:hypothetical protein